MSLTIKFDTSEAGEKYLDKTVINDFIRLYFF